MKTILYSLVVVSLIFAGHAQRHHQQEHHGQYSNVNNIPRDEKPDHHKEPIRESTTWIPILKYNKEQSEDGSYKTEYETGNNIQHEETGYLKDFSETNPNGVLVQHGQYSYQSPEGHIVNVQYTADENGFRATGDHIPTPPAIPEEIQKGLDQIYAGIKLQKERLDERARTDPGFAKKLEERRVANNNGQYVGILENNQ